MTTRVISAVLKFKDQNFASGMKNANNQTKDFDRKIKYARNTVKDFTSSSVKNFGNVAKSVAGIAAGFVAFNGIKNTLSSSIHTFADFEQGMANVKAVSGVAGQEFQALTDKAREMGSITSKTATEAADGLQYLALAGWDTEQMLKGIEPVLRLSEAGALDLGLASDLVTDSMSALGIGVDGLSGYLDQVAQTARRSNTNIDTLMQAFLVAGGNFKTFNVPMEEANALLGIMANRGYKGAEAGTALNAITSNLTSGLGASGKAMKQLGLSAFDNQGKFKGLENVLLELKGKMDTMNDAQKAQYISMIAGKEHMKTFTGIMDGLGNEYQALKDEVKNADGALMDMANTQMDTMQGSLKLMESAIDDVKITLGGGLAPTVRKFAEMISDKMPVIQKHTENAVSKLPVIKDKIIDMYNATKPALSWMKDTAFPMLKDGIGFTVDKAQYLYNVFVNNWSAISPVVAGVAAALATYKVGVIAVTAATSAWRGITAATAVAMGILNGTLAISPLGWIVLGVGAVVAAMVLLHKNTDRIKRVWSSAWSSIKQAAETSVNAVIGALNKMIDVINKIPGVNIPVIPKVDWSNVSTMPMQDNRVANGSTSEIKMLSSYDVGSNRIAQDHIAQVHKDEMIIPARQAEKVRQAGGTIDNIDKLINKQPQITPTGINQSNNNPNPVSIVIQNLNAKGVTASEVVSELAPQLKLAMSNM